MSDHVKWLEAAREKLVERRRKAAKKADLTVFLTQLLQAQHDIEVVDRAIADEKRLTPAEYGIRAV